MLLTSREKIILKIVTGLERQKKDCFIESIANEVLALRRRGIFIKNWDTVRFYLKNAYPLELVKCRVNHFRATKACWACSLKTKKERNSSSVGRAES